MSEVATIVAGARQRQAQASRYCLKCGRSDLEVEFRSERVQRCTACEADLKEEQLAFQRAYTQARHAAVQRLIEAHRDDYEVFKEEELDRRRDAEGNLRAELQMPQKSNLRRAKAS